MSLLFTRILKQRTLHQTGLSFISRRNHSFYSNPISLSSSIVFTTFAALAIVSHSSHQAYSMSTSSTTSTSTSSSSSNPLKSRAAVIEPKSKQHKNTIIWLHGLGDSSDGFIDLFNSLPIPYTKVVLPNAPVQRVTANGGMRMPSWYDIVTFDRRQGIDSKEDETGILKSGEAVAALVDEEVSIIGAENVLLGGFSQGAAMSLHTALRGKHKLAGVVSCSGYLLLHKQYPEKLGPHATSIPVLVYHGIEDGTVPFAYGKRSAELLKQFGVPLTFHSEEGLTHSVSQKELIVLLQFVKEKLRF